MSKVDKKKEMEGYITQHLYDINALNKLEDYVVEQINDALYDFDSNLYLMKMYSLYPNKANSDIVIKILIKALMNLPNYDFTALVYLIPITMASNKDINGILTMGQYLEDCEFDQFWPSLKANENILKEFNTFTFCIRKYICQVIGAVFQNINTKFLCELLNFNNDQQLGEFLTDLQWNWKLNDDFVEIPKNEANSAETTKKIQTITTDQMNTILGTVV